MIKGIGVDVVELSRIKKRIKNKILSDEELEFYDTLRTDNRCIEFLAGRFASKEALIKSFKIFIPYSKVSVLKAEGGEPYISQKTINYLKKEKNFSFSNIRVSIAHEKKYAVSFVVVELGGNYDS